MEWIFMLQPAAHTFSVLSIIAAIILAICYGVFSGVAADRDTNSELRPVFKSGAVIAKRWAICLLVLFFISLPIGQSWNAFKRLTVYRAVTSDTTEKAVDTLEALLDKLGAKIEKL